MELSFKVGLLPDEHMLGGVARTLLLSGEKTLSEAQLKLCGRQVPLSSWVLVHSAMNVYLRDAIDKRAREKLLLKHSLLGYYSHGLPYKSVKAALNDCMRDATTPRIPQVTKQRFTGTWRYCPVCAESDFAHHGIAYWRVSHQLPTSLTCEHHPEIRLISGCKTCGSDITDLIQSPYPNINSCRKCGCAVEHEIHRHSEISSWIQTQGLKLHHDADDLVRLKYAHAMKYGVELWATQKKILGYQRLEKAQSEFLIWMQDNDLDCYFNTSSMEPNDFSTRLYSAIRYAEGVPPLTHLLAYSFLGLTDFDQLVLKHDQLPSATTLD